MSAMDWTYYTFRDGQLFDEDGDLAFAGLRFNSASDADGWLCDNDVRGSVR